MRTTGVARESYRQMRESLRKPEAPEVLALREEASDLVEELGRLITQASRTAEETTDGEWADTLDSLIVELSRGIDAGGRRRSLVVRPSYPKAVRTDGVYGVDLARM